MSSSDDFPGDMEEFPFDDHDSDAVFGAAPGTPDVPESLRDVTELVHASRRSASADELVGADAMVAEIAAAIGEHAAPPRRGADERIPVLNRYRTAKLAAAATAVLMLGGTAAAAATGTLPSPVAPSHHRVELASMHESPPAVTPVKAQHHSEHHHRRGLFGTVAAVNGVSDDGTCGTADTAGAFTLTGRKGKTYTVNVDTTTAYSGKDLTDPSFANVCVGTFVKVKGMIDDTTITATKVRIKPPHVHEQEQDHVFGQVASVNGVSDPGTCGAADAAGMFTVTGFKGDTFTVNVDPATAFAAKDVTDATFANVCVGLAAFAKGTLADTTLTATQVFVTPPKTEDDHHDHEHEGAFGAVASVNGVSDPGTCGVAGTDGSFTITDRDGNVFTVNVTADTKFLGKHHHDNSDGSSFADVCVGKTAGAKGTVTDSTVAAEKVFVLGEHDGEHDGRKHDRDGDQQGDDHESGKHASFSSDRSGSDGEHHDHHRGSHHHDGGHQD